MGPRLLFQKVPEGKTVKNRWHLDIDGVDRSLPEDQHGQSREDMIEALVDRGATEVARFDEPVGKWVVMTDPRRQRVLRPVTPVPEVSLRPPPPVRRRRRRVPLSGPTRADSRG